MGLVPKKGPRKFLSAPVPLPPRVVNDVVIANQKDEDVSILIDDTLDIGTEDILNYLSYSYIKFHVPEDMKNLRACLLKSNLWFNRNNVVFDYFEANNSRLHKLLARYFNPDLETLKNGFDDLDDFTLAELSILEFSEYIEGLVQENGLSVNIERQEQALEFSSKRSQVFHSLQRECKSRGAILNLLPDLYNKDVLLFKYKDTLNKNIESSSLPLGSSKYNTINLHLEVLNSCSYACAGCYVKRKNKLPENWAEQLNQKLKDSHFTEWNEVVVGPTDIFSASNFDEVFDSKQTWMTDVLSRFSAVTFNSTLCMSDDEIKNKFDKLKSLFPTKQLEFFIIVDINQFLSEDPKYMGWLKRKIELLEDSNIILTINTPNFFYWRFEAPGEIAYRHFGKNFKYTPSFFRSNNKKIISDHLNTWSNHCVGHTNVLNYTHDRYFGGETYTTFVYKAGELYWSPCLIDFVFIEDEKFKCHDSNSVRDLRLERAQGDCQTCPEKTNCRIRGILTVKNYLGKSECILPDDFVSAKQTA